VKDELPCTTSITHHSALLRQLALTYDDANLSLKVRNAGNRKVMREERKRPPFSNTNQLMVIIFAPL